ncbi:MAG TPA: orotidine-5'-phosphate decarboxylase [Vicinamibacterales bacterium]|nr:orotidine-5'-phosphate decarboxylase [Vicinamibacterales bacterium]
MNRILVALDVDRAADAVSLADTLRGVVGGIKIGSQLFTAAGPDVVRTLASQGHRVFLDLKFHDIPNTVAGAVRSACGLGVWMVNVHASGGRPMMEAARRAADAHADAAGSRPLVIAVTVLTSLNAEDLASIGLPHSPDDQVLRLAALAQSSGLDGVVASPRETAAIRDACGPDFVIVTPGIRGGGAIAAPDDQQRTLSPAEAVAAGSSYLVVGRPITAAPDPRDAAMRIAKESDR